MYQSTYKNYLKVNYNNVIWTILCLINICMLCSFVTCADHDKNETSCDKTRKVITSSSGNITDGPIDSNYTQDTHCEWLIRANGTGQFITLKFLSMGTECSYDYVFVYDGDSFRSPLLGSFSGKTAPQQVIASSGYMLILLYSDTNYVLNGFHAEFFVTDCPNNCTSQEHGVCFNHQCVCTDDWGGDDCSHRLCPDRCGIDQGHGKCDLGKCICQTGYSGTACSLHNADPVGNKWHWLSHTGGGLTPRAAHTAVYVEEVDALYVYGGYDLNRVLGALEIYSFMNNTWINSDGDYLEDKTLQKQIDPALIGQLLHYNSPIAEARWGLPKTNSFFRNLLFGFSDTSSPARRRYIRSDTIPGDGVEPAPRYGHAACPIPEGFLIYGGKLDNGSLSNELWSYNVFRRKWQLRAQNSEIIPPALTRHSLTNTGGEIYLFGGSTTDGEFSSRLFKIELLPDGEEKWQYVQPRGGKELDVRVVAHSTVFHAPSHSLLVYGGVVAGVARFSKLSDRMFSFNLANKHWTELHYPREHLREKFVPRERAFHTANIIGNYLVVFGGYSHRHNKEEICYDNQMYLYHLGCHAWVSPDILGESQDSQYPKQQGVFAHSASVRNDNTLLLIGGYHGNVNGDLLAYTVPPMVAARKGDHYEPESACSRHKKYLECSADPECGWCSIDEQCYGRTVGANCTTNLQTTRCPGVCPALGDCHSCLIHGKPTSTLLVSAAHKLGLGECTWCVQNARCHHKDDNYGVCGLREDTPSQVPGWWGAKGTEVHKPEECRELDKRPGLTFLKYHHPVNWSQPDHVGIINATTVDFSPPAGPIHSKIKQQGEMVTRLLGFLRPPTQWQSKQEKLQVCVMYCDTTLKLLDLKGEVQLKTNLSADNQQCISLNWLVPDAKTNRILVDFEAHKTINNIYTHPPQQSKMELQHYRDTETAKVFTFEYLEPYANGSCSQYKNCLHCLTDSLCGWCELTSKCVNRDLDERESCQLNDDWRYLTLLPSACSNCSNYISCEKCVGSSLCEWWSEDARCVRIGSGAQDAVISLKYCPVPCFARSDCTSCLDDRGRCVWCEATQQCFSFSVYTSEYQFGLCREWLDQISQTQELSVIPARRADQCKSCQSHTNCSTCLSSLSCGWCYNAINPIEGKCVQGDFNRPQNSCENVLGMHNFNFTRWAYASCPDVDECRLNLHDCHKDAICTNTDGSFECICRQGFTGDGRRVCNRTCDHPCNNGRCLGSPNYTCECEIGWTGANCSIDCGCNFHSNCTTGVGICDSCQHWTTGENCDQCLQGSYGNATTKEGCKQCNCNGHGNVTAGICNIQTGECYCQDNTIGKNCEECQPRYYGDPTNGGQCYYQCEARGMLTDNIGQGISSRKSYVSPWGGDPTRECLWIISPTEKNAIIQLQINQSHLNVTCTENAVYVYDGMPELAEPQSALMAIFCKEDARPTMIVETKSGHLTVHYKQSKQGEGFDAVYKVLTCSNCDPPRYCKNDICTCPDGLVGPNCTESICPNNCGADLDPKHGECDHNYGRCLCSQGWGGKSCNVSITGSQMVFTELFNTQNLAPSYEHLRKTLPRFGHALVADHRRGLWMFGGFSLSHGPLNDIRLFDILNSTWMQVTVDSGPDAKMPQGRYFHAADIVHSRQAIYVFGGLTKHIRNILNENILNDLWQFDLHNQRWNEILPKDENWPPVVGGHTLTCYKNATYDSLILIGGFSAQEGFLNQPWEFRFDNQTWSPMDVRGNGPPGIFGHTTVFHAPTNSLYVFGGYLWKPSGTQASNKLFALRYDTMMWVDMNDIGKIISPSPSPIRPQPRYLHSAITTDNYMLIYGGRMGNWNYTNSFFAYSYNCSQWINIINITSEDVDRVGPYPTQTYSQAMTFANGTAYVVGGWGSESQYKVTRISLPEDLCEFWSKSKYKCLQYQGCGFCSSEHNGQSLKHCLSNSRQISEQCVSSTGTVSTNNGKSCDLLSSLQCTQLTDCQKCLTVSTCQWCPSCDGGRGSCKPAGETCPRPEQCKEEDAPQPILHNEVCPDTDCYATDCRSCAAMPGCHWTRELQYFRCIRSNKTTTNCDDECVYYRHCIDCLDRSKCRWSTALNECIALNTQSLYCLGGVCGLVLEGRDRDYCPEPCDSFTQCSTCLRNAHCGWCALDNETGDGVCAEGSTEKPMLGTCRQLYKKYYHHESITDLTTMNFTWNYVRCPPENECLNDHHTCNRKSEICEDLKDGFQCKCAPGYSGTDVCKPVCTQGCVRGTCVKPDQCVCVFGYVGANCSIECQCNGHSNCAGPDRLNECLECHNNTMGDQCEKCKPLYVGNPSNRKRCDPCLDYCNGHSQICVEENSTDPPDLYFNMTIPELELYLKEGPATGRATCIRCANRTEGDKCEKCIAGHFRGTADLWLGCRPCNCHGHGDTCDPVTGDKCNCRNNTESNTTQCNAKNSNQNCSDVQCVKCREGYQGSPTDGHQCYKQMTVESKMCFDAKPIDECKMKPKPLVPGETVFFVVQPRFMNVDIRITVDVTQGSLNLFVSNKEDTFKVTPNFTLGIHDIDLDSKYKLIPPSEEDFHYENGNTYSWMEHTAQGLRTYVTIPRNTTLLAVKGLKDRLVITLPQDKHRLDITKFFIVLQALPSNDLMAPSTPSYGMVFFRQDQLHIDLFVFFSVFFSCFFLFLAACVVAWKAKQAADVRRARRRHVVEMLHMAQRPFATVTLFLGPSTPISNRRAKPRRPPLCDLRPVAVEPTDDGIAAVATVFVSLPGGQNTNVRLALGSSLILLVRQYPSGGRAFLRRRSNHAVPQPT